MQIPGNLPLYGDRWTPLACTIEFLGFDFTDATFSMQVRLAGDTPGSPLISLGTVFSAGLEGIRLIYGGTDTVANHIAAGRLNLVPSGLTEASTVELSQVGILISENTMEVMPDGDEPGDDVVLAWDIHITPLGGVKERWVYGDFTVRAGVTV
jgi:hypothetical protein